MMFVDKRQFRALAGAFVDKVTDSSLNDVFNSFFKKKEDKKEKNDENLNEDLNASKKGKDVSPRSRRKLNVNVGSGLGSQGSPRGSPRSPRGGRFGTQE